MVLAYMGACGSGAVLPNQTDVDAVIQRLVAEVSDLAGKFPSTIDCNQFVTIANSLVGEADCAQGGSTSTFIITAPECSSDGTQLTGTFVAGVSSDNCTFDGKATKGGIQNNVSLEDLTFTDLLSSSDLVVIGIQLIFSDFSVAIDENGVPTCSGTLTLNKGTATCTVASDCSTCPVEAL